MNARWQLKYHLREGHSREVYGVAFNETAASNYHLFAAAETSGVKLLHAYVVEQGKETFYVVKWMLLSDSTSVIVAAGDRGPIHAIDSQNSRQTFLLLGHGNSIVRYLLGTGKIRDESIRLWNVKKRVPLIVFSGNEAHGGEVLFVSFHGFRDMIFASSGMDDAVKIWSWRDRTPFLEYAGTAADVACQIETPLFSSTALHGDYVDCVLWYGDVLISKSVDNKLVMWRPEIDMETLENCKVEPQSAFTVLREFDVPNCGLWYIRFALSFDMTAMACGNRTGVILLWNLDEDGMGTGVQKLQCRAHVPVRAIQFHALGHHLVAGYEDGSICVYACTAASKTASEVTGIEKESSVCEDDAAAPTPEALASPQDDSSDWEGMATDS